VGCHIADSSGLGDAPRAALCVTNLRCATNPQLLKYPKADLRGTEEEMRGQRPKVRKDWFPAVAGMSKVRGGLGNIYFAPGG
jgi:hypothetical protein